MAKVFLFVALFVIVVDAAHKHHPKFPKGSEEYDASDIKKVACSSENDRLRNEIIEKSRCGPPKEVFVYLEPTAAHEQVITMIIIIYKV
ncbi:unnamed protein product [Diatraea saccharalis]|uniref:Uncharacterized protein n=1 Tax=Diatraea saccharalis TaxID=40085 RepID=A0A9N9R9J1_9NEOP|nr:unnamed protein product [Diatraea saccharalis]